MCQFQDFLNSLYPSLKFKMTVGENDELTFLDLRIMLKNNKLFTTVYSKPTSSQMYLHADSIHPKSTFTGIQKGVSLRLRKFVQQMRNLMKGQKNTNLIWLQKDIILLAY